MFRGKIYQRYQHSVSVIREAFALGEIASIIVSCNRLLRRWALWKSKCTSNDANFLATFAKCNHLSFITEFRRTRRWRRTCTDSDVWSDADLRWRPTVAIRIVADIKDDVAAQESAAGEHGVAALHTRRATTASHSLDADRSGFQRIVQLTRQLCDPAAGSLTSADALRLTFHPSNWWNGLSPAWLPVTRRTQSRRPDAEKTRNSFGRLSLDALSLAFRRPWSVFSRLWSVLRVIRRRQCIATQRDYTGQQRRHSLTNKLLLLLLFGLSCRNASTERSFTVSLTCRYQSIAGAAPEQPYHAVGFTMLSRCPARPISEADL